MNRPHVALSVLFLASGCAAAPAVTVHVDPVRVARLSPVVVEQVDVGFHAAAVEVDNDLAHGTERIAHAREALRVAKGEAPTADGSAIRAARVERAEHEFDWQLALLEVTRWRGVVNIAASELAKAELLVRCGQEIDVDAFTEQHRRLRAGLAEASRRTAKARARFEDSDRRLTAAKADYTRKHGLGTMVSSAHHP